MKICRIFYFDFNESSIFAELIKIKKCVGSSEFLSKKSGSRVFSL